MAQFSFHYRDCSALCFCIRIALSIIPLNYSLYFFDFVSANSFAAFIYSHSNTIKLINPLKLKDK